jgi:NADH-quinone oxidoreductase subunit A
MNFQPITTGMSPWTPGIFSLLIYAAVVLGLIGILLFLCRWLGERRENPEKVRPYECGIIPSGMVRLPYTAPFYLVAIFFLIFDVEGAYIFSWAVAFKTLSWAGWLEITFFIVVLALSLVYIWRKGGLDWT